jgi:hypothetical protein
VTPSIDVRCGPAGNGWECRVTVSQGASRTSHDVRLTAADLARLAPGAADPEDLVVRSFRFLLAREPKESILARFDLPLIGRYFPEYEREISGR